MRPIEDKPWESSLVDDCQWSDVCNSLQVVEVAGNHYTMIYGDYSKPLIDKMLSTIHLCMRKDPEVRPLAVTSVIQKVPEPEQAQGVISSLFCAAKRSTQPGFEITVTVHYPDRRRSEWMLIRRYSHFVTLMNELSKTGLDKKLPELPPKKALMTESAARQRTESLNYFLTTLVAKYSANPAVQLFLGAPEHLLLICVL